MINKLQENKLWKNAINPIWPATTFTIHRNLARHSFPGKLPTMQKEQLALLLKDLILKNKESEYLDFGAMSGSEREYVHEHFFLGRTFGKPEPGTGAVIDSEARFLGQINVEDHLILHLIDHKDSWNDAWNALQGIERDLTNHLEYAYSPKFGYLTARPQLCGTGLKVTAFLHLPAIVNMGQLQNALIEEVNQEVVPRSLGGEEGEYPGDLIALTNRYAIGIAEDQMMRHLFGSVNKLMNAEKTLRCHLKEEKNPDIIDRMSRSLGLLTHSKQLGTQEALSALSLIKLGLDLGWVQGVSDEKINELMFDCRRAHLVTDAGDTLSQEDLLKKRAEKMQNALKNTEMTA